MRDIQVVIANALPAPAVWSVESVTLICRDDGASALSVVLAITFAVTAAVLVH